MDERTPEQNQDSQDLVALTPLAQAMLDLDNLMVFLATTLDQPTQESSLNLESLYDLDPYLDDEYNTLAE